MEKTGQEDGWTGVVSVTDGKDYTGRWMDWCG